MGGRGVGRPSITEGAPTDKTAEHPDGPARPSHSPRCQGRVEGAGEGPVGRDRPAPEASPTLCTGELRWHGRWASEEGLGAPGTALAQGDAEALARWSSMLSPAFTAGGRPRGYESGPPSHGGGMRTNPGGIVAGGDQEKRSQPSPTVDTSRRCWCTCAGAHTHRLSPSVLDTRGSSDATARWPTGFERVGPDRSPGLPTPHGS